MARPMLTSGPSKHASFTMPTFNGLWFGWWMYNLAESQEIWIDEIAVDYKPIGCAKVRTASEPGHVGWIARECDRVRSVRDRQLSPADAACFSLRAARSKEVPRLLKLIDGAIDHGCRDHYDYDQIRAVLLSYCADFVVDAVGPFQTLVAEIDGRLAGVAQLDVAAGVLRALFVDAAIQGQGVGGALLAAVEACARAAGCARIRGAMSLNAVSFYTRAGFRPCDTTGRLERGGVEVQVVWMEKSLES